MNSNTAAENNCSQEEIITFPEGLIGLENYRRFVLKTLPEQTVFKVLQSLDDEEFAVVVTSPFWFVPDYAFELTGGYQAQLGGTEDIELFVTITLAPDLADMTANLLGPVIISRQTGKGYQILASDKDYTTKYKIYQKAGGK
jgi:flagellar assembly factor FliW